MRCFLPFINMTNNSRGAGEIVMPMKMEVEEAPAASVVPVSAPAPPVPTPTPTVSAPVAIAQFAPPQPMAMQAPANDASGMPGAAAPAEDADDVFKMLMEEEKSVF